MTQPGDDGTADDAADEPATSRRPWVVPALIQAGVFTAVFVVLNLLIADDPGWFLALFSMVMFGVFFGISARAQRRRRT